MEIIKVNSDQMLKFFNYKDNKSKLTKNKTFYIIKSNGTSQVYEEKPTIDSIYIVMKNADFTEGRGPMIFDKAFKDYDNAVLYILSQDGIYGSSQCPSNYPGINVIGDAYCVSGFNGYTIKIAKLN